MAGATTLHATAVALSGNGVLILGQPGAGKSTLGIGLIALGADLIADDIVRLDATADGVVLAAPSEVAPLIEARGIGLLRARSSGPAACALVVDLDRDAGGARLPHAVYCDLLGHRVRVIYGHSAQGLAAAIVVAMTGQGLSDPDAIVGPPHVQDDG